jgi:maleylpyruvate isomerase
MTDPHVRLAQLRDSTSALLSGFAEQGWQDEDMRAPSLLPGWTRGHVLTHLARNADGIVRTFAGALRGERVPRYPHGEAGRDADIEAGAGRSAAQLLDDVRTSAETLDRACAEVDAAAGWELPTDNRPAGEYLPARWHEVEIHRLDVGGYRSSLWSAEFVSYLLPALGSRLDRFATTPLRLRVLAENSLAPALGGREWTSGLPPWTDVAAADHVLLCWLTGRQASLKDGQRSSLVGAPPLHSWG